MVVKEMATPEASAFDESGEFEDEQAARLLRTGVIEPWS